MLIPLVGLILGIALLGFTILAYTGNILLQYTLVGFKPKGNQPFVIGGSLLSIALMLGIVGYFGYLNAPDLRLLRIILVIVGLLLILISLVDKNKYLVKVDNIIGLLTSFINIKSILILLSSSVLISIFLVSFFDANYGGDAFMYHMPFAARIWGIITSEQYTFEFFTEHRFKGLPLLAHFLQGFFWVIFQRPEATNLVCFFSLIILLLFLRFYLQIPFYISTIALLAVPMVHMHAGRSYIDLVVNVCISILILMTYLLYTNKLVFSKKNLLVIFLSAVGGANIKHQAIPVVFIILCFIFQQLFVNYWQKEENNKTNLIRLFKLFICCSLASVLIFATSVKNILIYKNPFYPVKVEIAGIVLNHTEAPPDFMHENIRKFPPPIRWARSVLEINAFDKRRPWHWTLAMDFISWDQETFGVGGYFGGYVIFNLLLFIYLCWKISNRETKVAAILMIIMSLLVSIMPQSYELRYHMYWMIVLVSINAYLVSRLEQNSSSKQKIVNLKNLGFVAAAFMIVFMNKTKYFYTIPKFSSLSEHIQQEYVVEQKIFNQIKDGDKICLVGKSPHAFFYNSYFHPPANYYIQAEFDISDEFVKEKCGALKIIK
ncbi:MAG: hypothetical protein F6K10_11800 [Moorea sp. SIO2B7]|nr:hypothetical protein [Moorena sp. SIO2B7]